MNFQFVEMMSISKWVLFLICFSTSICEHIIRTRYDFRTLTRFPVGLFSPELNRNISGFASLDLSEELVGFSSSSDSADEVFVSQLFFAGLALSYRYRVPLDWNEDSSPTAHINADMSSELLRQVGSYLMTPISHSEGMIVLSPDNPRLFAYNNELFYSNCVHQDVLQVMAAVETVTFERRNIAPTPLARSQFFRCSIVTGHHDDEDDEEEQERIWIPPNAWEVFSAELVRLGLVTARNLRRNSFDDSILIDRNLTESVMDSLPSLRFIVELDDGSQASVLLIEPREYFYPRDNDETVVELKVFSSTIPFCEFGKRFLKRTVIHVDSVNHRIGFGDPLIEI